MNWSEENKEEAQKDILGRSLWFSGGAVVTGGSYVLAHGMHISSLVKQSSLVRINCSVDSANCIRPLVKRVLKELSSPPLR
jgi:hypothetical protein